MPKMFMEGQPRNKRVLGARELFERALKGGIRARADLQEALSTSDFPYLLGAGYDRELISAYNAIDPIWPSFATRRTVPNFKDRTLIDLLGGRAGLDKVKEGAEYKARGVTESKKSFKVEKYGAVIPLTWEMFINDDLGAFDSLPDRLATAARETEERNAASVFFNAAGTGLSTWADARDVTSKNLTADNLQGGIDAISTRTDADGRPVITPGLRLMVPPSLANVANAIVKTLRVKDPTTGREIEGNGLSATPEVVVNPWLTVVGSGYASVSKMWALLPDPNSARPHIVEAFLAGHETPDLRVKSDAGDRVGGGSIDPLEGSFDDDQIRYRVRHENGAAALWDDALYIGIGS
ncbi:phage major capsid protein [Cellulomonas rhizosphaerae]|uniref:Phage major capsid protein n=1 Tax=Cellulomonas rhizosphaerae TaxID=2293719 RepID=A0A413RJN7_9CELL|nr:phage major capsid protein [Cellulomonas rhizosphaerae]RHA38734.1 phage major capsid protein [Cellulomonas rhizosphaerae]